MSDLGNLGVLKDDVIISKPYYDYCYHRVDSCHRVKRDTSFIESLESHEIILLIFWILPVDLVGVVPCANETTLVKA